MLKALTQFLHTQLASITYPISNGTDGRLDGRTSSVPYAYVSRGIITEPLVDGTMRAMGVFMVILRPGRTALCFLIIYFKNNFRSCNKTE